MGRVEGESKK